MNEPKLTGPDPVLVGIVNVTPDSFSDGGLYIDPDRAIAHGLRLCAEGAHILDIGGESTQPGATPVSPEEEIARVIPVIRGLKNCGALLSIDTRHAQTMHAAIDAGAGMINDVTAFAHNPEGLRIAAEAGVFLCLMHMQGTPQTMQDAPRYKDVFAEVYDFLALRAEVAVKAGVKPGRLILDPGIGFGKTLEHNLTLLNRLDDFDDLGVPVMLGASRKRFIETILPESGKNRLPGSLAAVLASYLKGVRIFRVHDVAETVQALAVYRRILDK